MDPEAARLSIGGVAVLALVRLLPGGPDPGALDQGRGYFLLVHHRARDGQLVVLGRPGSGRFVMARSLVGLASTEGKRGGGRGEGKPKPKPKPSS